jgi:tRNA pseudouridine55 synthase
VFKIEILDWRPGDFPELDVEIACSSGTYIRAIARDLGAALQTGGTLAGLIRTQSSGFCLVDSLSLDELATQLEQGTFQPIPPTDALQHLGALTLPVTVAQRWCQGQRIPWDKPDGGVINSPLRVDDESDRFLGIGHLVESDDAHLLIPQMVFEPI